MRNMMRFLGCLLSVLVYSLCADAMNVKAAYDARFGCFLDRTAFKANIFMEATAPVVCDKLTVMEIKLSIQQHRELLPKLDKAMYPHLISHPHCARRWLYEERTLSSEIIEMIVEYVAAPPCPLFELFVQKKCDKKLFLEVLTKLENLRSVFLYFNTKCSKRNKKMTILRTNSKIAPWIHSPPSICKMKNLQDQVSFTQSYFFLINIRSLLVNFSDL